MDLNRRFWSNDVQSIIRAEGHYGNALLTFSRDNEALPILRSVHEKRVALLGPRDRDSIGAANSIVLALTNLDRFAEARAVSRQNLTFAREDLGRNDDTWLRVAGAFSRAVLNDNECPAAELREMSKVMDDTSRAARLMLGATHPVARQLEIDLARVRARLS